MDGNRTSEQSPAAPAPAGPTVVSRLRERRTDASSAGDGGYVLLTLGLLLVPLMAFSALAVDVGSWYARTTQLQKAADSAALAGVIWAPDYTHARTVAAVTLTDNDFPATNAASQTSGDISITMNAGSAPNSFRVCITDAKAPVFFAAVFSANPVSLTRCATAVYYLPIPMGSPFTFFGGDASKYGLPFTTTTPSTLLPGGPYSDPSVYVDGGGTTYTFVQTKNSKGNYACQTSAAFRSHGARLYVAVAPSPATYTNPPPGNTTNTVPTGLSVPSPLPTCTWDVYYITTTTGTGPQPIDYNSPGFWANIMGPESDSVNGDAHAPACYGGNNCVSGGVANPPNYDYRPTKPDGTGGYTYTLTVGAAPASVDFKVFDAGLYPRTCTAPCNPQTVETGDSVDNGTDFTTRYDLYRANTTPVDLTNLTKLSASDCGGGSGNAPQSGSWSLNKNSNTATFKNNWVTLCTFAPSPNTTYILKVRTDHSADTAAYGSGSNRYALRADGSGGGSMQLSAYNDMAIYNNIDSGTGQFFLAQVDSQYAGKTLDINLWDAGDASGTATVTVNAPPSAGTLGCTWKSIYGLNYTSAPSGGNGAGGTPNTPTASPGTITPCAIQTTISGARQFNGLWLQIRVPIPVGYSCTNVASPTFASPGCWWSIKYNFSTTGNTDNTTWAVNVEGDPIHLTE